MALRLLSLVSLSFVLCSQAFDTQARSARGLQKRDLVDFTQDILFTSPLVGGVFLEISVGDNIVPVEIDLQSSDLFVTGTLHDTAGIQTTGATANQLSFPFLSPPVTANAPISQSAIEIGGQTVQQAFASQPNDNAGLVTAFPFTSAHGVLGLGPTSNSLVSAAQKTGLSPMDNILANNASHPYYTILFAGDDTTQSATGLTDPEFAGFFSVGAPVQLDQIFAGEDVNLTGLPDLNSISTQPAIPLEPHAYSFSVDEISVTSDPSANVLNSTAILTTTSNYSIVPPNIISAIYGSGATPSPAGSYSLPCDTLIAMDFVIGGVTIPIDPATIVAQIPGTDQCVGTYRAQPAGPSPTDVVLGTNFLENVYVLLGYNTVSGQTLSDPYLKLLPLVNLTSANAEFQATRGSSASSGGAVHTSFTTMTVTHTPTTVVMIGGPTSSPASGAKVAEALDVAGNASNDNNSNSNNDLNLPTGSLSDKLKHCLPAIILGAFAVGLLLIGAVIFWAVSRRRRSGARDSAYRNIHHAEAADHSRALYGHEDENVRYSDPYSDKL